MFRKKKDQPTAKQMNELIMAVDKLTANLVEFRAHMSTATSAFVSISEYCRQMKEAMEKGNHENN